MAGIVDKDSNLRVTGGGGGGSNVTITAPLGSQPAAASVSVAIASDQLPLPVSGGGDGAILDGAVPAIRATVFNRTNSKPLATELVDANGDPIFVNPSKELSTTLLHHDSLVQKGDALQGGNVNYPVPNEGGPIVAAALLVNDVPNTTYVYAPGDATDGVFVNIKASVPVAVNVPTTATGALTAAGQTLAIDTTKANSVVVTISTTANITSGQWKFEGTNDNGVTWDKIYAKVLIGLNGVSDGTMLTTFSLTNIVAGQTIFIIPCGGFQQIRLNIISITGAGATVTFVLTTSSSDNLHDDKVELLGGLTGTKTPGDLIPNPTDAIPSESFTMGWDARNGSWSRANVDFNTGNLVNIENITRTPLNNSSGVISGNGYIQTIPIATGGTTGGGRGTFSIVGAFTGITVKLYITSPLSAGALVPILIRNVATRIVSLDTGVLDNPSNTLAFIYEFSLPALYTLVVTSTSYAAGFASWQVFYDKLPLNLTLPVDSPIAAKMNFNSPSYNQDGASVLLSSDQNGRLRVNTSDRELDFFGNNDAFLSVKDSPFSSDSPWS